MLHNFKNVFKNLFKNSALTIYLQGLNQTKSLYEMGLKQHHAQAAEKMPKKGYKNMTPIAKWSTIKSSWMLLGFAALGLELVALYFQYGMGLEPCIMCIYQRVAIMGIMLSGFITAMAPGVMLMRAFGFVGWAVSAVWGLFVAIEHVSIQTETDPFVFTTCQSMPNFPSWLQLHQWFPAIFEARGDCGDIDWQFLGYSMPQWMIVVFAGFTLAMVVVLAARVIKERTL